MEVASVVGPEGPTAESVTYVNYLDIKLHEVFNVPPEWYDSTSTATAGNANAKESVAKEAGVSSAGTAPAYNLHPFHYEVTLSWPAPEAEGAHEGPVPSTVGHAEAKGVGRPPSPATAEASANHSTILGRSAASTSTSGPKKGRKVGGAHVDPPPVSPTPDAEMSAVAPAQNHTAPSPPLVLFRHGRLLSPLPLYTRYVERAAPPAGAGGSDVSPLADVPAVLEEAVVVAKAHAGVAEGRGGDGVTGGGAAEADVQAPVLLWVCTSASSAPKDASAGAPASDAAPASSRRRAKKSGAAAQGAAGSVSTAGSAAQGAWPDALAPPPPLPDVQEVPPCVVRLPLTAAMEHYLRSLVRRGEPLVLTLYRVLKPNVPAEWEDLCAPYYTADIRVPLTSFAEPGSTATHVQVPLSPRLASTAAAEARWNETTAVPTGGSAATGPTAAPHDQKRKKAAARKAVKAGGVPSLLCEEPDPTQPHPYHRAGSTAVVSLRVAHTLTRLPQDRTRPGVTPMSLLATRTAAEGQISDVDVDAARAELDGGLGAVSEALESIAQQLLNAFVQFTQAQSRGGEDDTHQNTRALFLAFAQSTGQLTAYKQQLVPLVTRMAQQARAAAGATQDVDTAQLTSKLYVTLLERTHQILREVTVNASPSRVHGTHGKVTSTPKHGVDGGRDGTRVEPSQQTPQLSTPSTWSRRAEEAEVVDDFITAESCLQAQIAQVSSDLRTAPVDDHDASEAVPAWRVSDMWVDLADLYCRWERGHAHKAEACYREALTLAPTNVRALLHHGLFLLARHRHAEAEVFLQSAVDVQPRASLAWACLCVLFDSRLLDVATAGKCSADASDAAVVEEERRYALRKAEEAVQFSQHASASAPPVGEASCPTAKTGELSVLTTARAYLEVAQCTLGLHHRGLASLCLSRVNQLETKCVLVSAHVERLYAHLFLQGGQYTEARRAAQQCRASLAPHKTTSVAVPPERQEDAFTAAEADAWEAELAVVEVWCAQGEGETHAPPARQPLTASPQLIRALKGALCFGRCGNQNPGEYHADDGAQEADRHRATFLATVFSSPSLAGTPVQSGSGVVPLPHALPVGWWLAAYVRLSNMLLGGAMFRDALGVLAIAIEQWPRSALLWAGAGAAYLRLGDHPAAEACLSEANRLDSWNPRTWAMLALVALYRAPAPHVPRQPASAPARKVDVVEPVLARAFELGLKDVALLTELGKALLGRGYSSLAVEALQRALAIVDAPHDDATRVATVLPGSVHYHLAHAHMEEPRQKQAIRQLLDTVQGNAAAPPALRAKAQEAQHHIR